MWSRSLFIIWFLALTILTTQSHVIHKRGLLSKLFGRESKSNRNVEGDLPPRERSRFRDLLKNPVIITLISAAVGMIVQQALSARNMKDVCEHKYVKMAYSIGNLNPTLQQIVNLLGCNATDQQYGSSTISPGQGSNKPRNRLSTTTTAAPPDDENDDQEEEENDQENADSLQSGFPPEKESKIKQLLSIARGEKGAKRNFLKNLFGLNKNVKTFKAGQKLPSSSYKLDKDDANVLKELEKDLEQYNKSIH